MMQRLVMSFLVLSLAASLVFAQPDPNRGENALNPPVPAAGGGRLNNNPAYAIWQNQMNLTAPAAPIMEATQNGLFMLRAGVLVRFDPVTLKQTGVPIELFGKAPEQPKIADKLGDQEIAALQKWQQEMAKRTGPTAVLTKDDLLLIVIGDTFFKVSQKTGVTELTTDLAVKEDPAAPAAMAARPTITRNSNQVTAPTLKLNGNILYIYRNEQLISVNTTDGKVMGRGQLPKEMTPNLNINLRGLLGGALGWGGVQRQPQPAPVNPPAAPQRGADGAGGGGVFDF